VTLLWEQTVAVVFKKASFIGAPNSPADNFGIRFLAKSSSYS